MESDGASGHGPDAPQLGRRRRCSSAASRCCSGRSLRYLNQEYVLTNRRVIQVEGVVNKRAADSSLEKINDAVLTQSIFGRALGFGDLKILTAAEAAISEFRMLADPIEFKKAMLDAKHEYEIEVAGGDAGRRRRRCAPTPRRRRPRRAAAPTAAAAAGRRRHRSSDAAARAAPASPRRRDRR